jgi:ABC-type cobalamin/Fe3+-siderophores transport system ATPase subunit
MLITGPNGCGKSTLLYRLRNVNGENDILYLGPHRSSRRQSVRMRYLLQNNITMSTILSTGNLPGFEGIEVPNRARDAWNSDEASSYLKYSLCQIELDRQAALTARFDREGAISKAEIQGDVWDPLRELTENLLPHLKFDKIDVSNRDEVKCYFSVHSLNYPIDIDDLSSGEKSIIQLFYPLLESRVRDHIEALKTSDAKPADSREIAVIIDEPELHLHPNLQTKVLAYIRKVSLDSKTQFILATHSPTMVEYATSQELFLLRPSELVPADVNQLVQIASDDDKLHLMREVFGTTSNITAMRKILVVEGSAAHAESRSTADARIYGFLSDRFGQVTLVAGGGKSECKSLVERLNTTLKDVSPNLKSVALLDRDVDEAAADPDAIYLPVSMIENLLVDPDVIWAALTTVHHKLDLKSAKDVEAALDDILSGIEGHEVGRRTKAAFGAKFFRLKDPVAEAEKQVDKFIDALRADLDKAKVDKAIADATEKVGKLKTDSKRREYFDGKLVIREFHKNHVNKSGMSREIFIYQCAREASRRRSVEKFVRELFEVVGITSTATTAEREKKQEELAHKGEA